MGLPPLPVLPAFNLISSCSASLTSSSVRLPDSIRCATTGWLLPPKNASSSSMRRRCAEVREIAASKMWALPIFFVRRSPLLLQAIDHGLDGGVRRPPLLRKRFENLADRGRPAAPQRLHDLVFQPAQLRQSHDIS